MLAANAGGQERRYTLLVPTYNRPQELGQLLRFLARQGTPFPVLVLDSSRDDVRAANRDAIRAAGVDAQHIEFDPAIPPFEKFWRGTERVETEFASFCADDDLLLVASLEPILAFLAGHPNCAVAHGWYFAFRLAEVFELTGVAYCGSSIDDPQPLDRLYRLMRSYEALTYGVYRTALLRRILARVQGVKTNMARELLGSALAVIPGTAVRLPVLYHGRAMGPSLYVSDWHPVDYLISSPERLFEEYSSYRDLVVDFFAECGHPTRNRADLLRAVDQIHWRYAADYFKPPVLDYVFERVRAGAQRAEIMNGMWPLLLGPDRDDSAFAQFARRVAGPLRRAAASLGAAVRRSGGEAGLAVRGSSTRAGRVYRLHPAFRRPVEADAVLRHGVPALLQTLDAYG